jgi:hypothetical protein
VLLLVPSTEVLPDRPLTPLGWEMLRDLPPVLEEDPHYRAVIHAYAWEVDLLQDRVNRLIAALQPATEDELGLPLWEALLHLSPSGSRQSRSRVVQSNIQRVGGATEGRDWEDAVTKLIGPSWTYREHQAGVTGTPPAYTVRVILPYPPTSDRYGDVRRLLREITPAHLDLEVIYEGGFLVDYSQLDLEIL